MKMRSLDSIPADLAARLEARYAQGYPGPAAVLRDGSRKLRVLGVAWSTSNYQRYCLRDIVASLRQLGVEAEAALLASDPSLHRPLLERIEAFGPDILFCNGRGRADFPPLPGALCVLSWDQDYAQSHPMRRYADHVRGHDRLLTLLSEWRREALDAGVPAGHVAHLNLGANLEIYHPTTSVPEAPDYDVLFVGNHYPWEPYRRFIGFHNLPEPLQRGMERARTDLAAWIRETPESPSVLPDLSSLLQGAFRACGVPVPPAGHGWRLLVRDFRYRVAHPLLRQLYLPALREFKLGLFGSAWEQLGMPSQGQIENGTPLREAIHRSAIVLHLHTWTVHHPRLYDTAAAGGFLLVGRVEEDTPLTRVFDPQRELDTFGSIDEMKRKIRHYLAHPEERLARSRRAAERAARDHSMVDRMADCLRGFDPTFTRAPRELDLAAAGR